MLIDDALHEARRLQASLRSMRVEQAAVEEAELLCRALQHDPVENVLPFALDALVRIDAQLPEGALAGLVRARLRHLVGMILTIQEQAWTAWQLAIPAERLQQPFSPRIAAVLNLISCLEVARLDQNGTAAPNLQAQIPDAALRAPS